MMVAYEALVLRYVHDLVTGESLNVGVLIYSRTACTLQLKCATALGRVTEAFARDVEALEIKARLRKLEAQASTLEWDLLRAITGFTKPDSIIGWAKLILPKDDSSLQFEDAPRAGITNDLDQLGAELFDRLVARYAKGAVRPSRTDEEVFNSAYKPALKSEHVAQQLKPVTIKSADYGYKFEYAYQNGKWNALEPVSFDLLESDSILDKATKWLGRADELARSKEKFSVAFLIGNPSNDRLSSPFNRALNILNRMPIDKEFVREHEAESFARDVAEQMEAHRH